MQILRGDLMNILEVKNLNKHFGATAALQNVSFDVEKGKVHALLGENGAGKSTFIKIISGLLTEYTGQMIFDGKSYAPKTVMEARYSGISTAFQELSLLSNLTVAENLALPKLKHSKQTLISRKYNEQQAAEILNRYNLSEISPSKLVSTLSLALKQKLEIVRAISHQPKLLLLDEPTAALPDPEWLFDLIEQLSDTNIIYISHRIGEIRRLCQTATILRNASSIDTVNLEDISNTGIFQMMAGKKKIVSYSSSETEDSKQLDDEKIGMEVTDLTGKKIKDVSFKLRKGEILGFAGLEGQGQSELFKILAGIDKSTSGLISIDDQSIKIKNPKDAQQHGIGYVPEERKTEGIFNGMKSLSNITISSLNQVSRLGFIGRKKEFKKAKDFSQKVQMEQKFLSKDIESLSGGNQQKAIVGRVLMTNASYLLLYDPTRGVDVGTKQTFFEMMKTFVENGNSIIWYSTDLSELVNVCDRCLVFYNGEIVSNIQKTDLTMENILYAATGHTRSGQGAAI